jgi:hypothetical protein
MSKLFPDLNINKEDNMVCCCLGSFENKISSDLLKKKKSYINCLKNRFQV